jgi:hypothetical protein
MEKNPFALHTRIARPRHAGLRATITYIEKVLHHKQNDLERELCGRKYTSKEQVICSNWHYAPNSQVSRIEHQALLATVAYVRREAPSWATPLDSFLRAQLAVLASHAVPLTYVEGYRCLAGKIEYRAWCLLRGRVIDLAIGRSSRRGDGCVHRTNYFIRGHLPPGSAYVGRVIPIELVRERYATRGKHLPILLIYDTHQGEPVAGRMWDRPI